MILLQPGPPFDLELGDVLPAFHVLGPFFLKKDVELFLKGAAALLQRDVASRWHVIDFDQLGLEIEVVLVDPCRHLSGNGFPGFDVPVHVGDDVGETTDLAEQDVFERSPSVGWLTPGAWQRIAGRIGGHGVEDPFGRFPPTYIPLRALGLDL